MNSFCYLSTAYWAPIQYFTKLYIFEKIFIEQFETYPKQTYRNRSIIYGANGAQSLQVPVMKGSFKNIVIKDIEISYSDNWQKNHLKSIESAYRSSPFFEYYIDDIAPFYEKKFKYLIDFNQKILETSLKMIKLKKCIEFTNGFELQPNGFDLRNNIHPKVEKQVHDSFFRALNYTQVFEQRHGFIPNLSILDLIFNTGPEAGNILKSCIITKN